MIYKTSPSQRRAVNNYNNRHKKKANRSRYKATAKSFINNRATKSELVDFDSLIHSKLRDLN